MEKLDYKIEWIPTSKLSVIWRKSQRQFDEKWAQKIAGMFDPDMVNPVIVTQPNGQGIYHIIDGQHTKHAIELAMGQGQQAPCKVIGDADPSRAAQIWLGINRDGRKAPKPVASFLVAIEAKEELEVAINKVVRSAGYHIGTNTKTDNNVASISSLKKIYQNYGDKILLQTLCTCRNIWGADSKGASGSIISGLGMFLNEFGGHVNVNVLKKSITDNFKSPGGFIEATRGESERQNETMDVAMSELIRMKYNKRAKEKLKRRENL